MMFIAFVSVLHAIVVPYAARAILVRHAHPIGLGRFYFVFDLAFWVALYWWLFIRRFPTRRKRQ